MAKSKENRNSKKDEEIKTLETTIETLKNQDLFRSGPMHWQDDPIIRDLQQKLDAMKAEKDKK